MLLYYFMNKIFFLEKLNKLLIFRICRTIFKKEYSPIIRLRYPIVHPLKFYFPELISGCPPECLCTTQQETVTVNCEYRSKEMLPLLVNIPQKTDIINVEDNDIASMDFDEGVNGLNKFRRMSILNLKHNYIKVFKTLSLKIYFPSITKLILSHNLITHLKAALVATFDNLTELDLSNNLIHFIQQNVFMKMKNLMQLNLNWNKIHFMHGDTFKGLVHLLTLNMSYNQMEILNISLFQSHQI